MKTKYRKAYDQGRKTGERIVKAVHEELRYSPSLVKREVLGKLCHATDGVSAGFFDGLYDRLSDEIDKLLNEEQVEAEREYQRQVIGED